MELNHSSGVAKAGLTTGIIGTALGAMNGGGGILSNLFGCGCGIGNKNSGSGTASQLYVLRLKCLGNLRSKYRCYTRVNKQGFGGVTY